MITALILAGVALFGLGATTAHLSDKAEKDFPPKGRIVEAGGIRQHVLEQAPPGDGDAPALVMIHGAYGAAEDFAVSLMPATAGRFRTIAVDRPGHGYSERGDDTAIAPDQQARYLRAALQELDVRPPFILLGFSYGGAVALSYALQFPGDVSAMVLVSAASHPYRQSPVSLSTVTGLPLLGPLLRHTVVTPIGHLVKDRGIARVFAPDPVPPAYHKAPVALSIRPHSYAANSEDIDRLSAFLERQAPRYPDLRLPVFIVFNDNDRTVSAAIHSRSLARQVPGAELIAVEGGGHPLHFSQPQAVLEAIDRAAAAAGVRR